MYVEQALNLATVSARRSTLPPESNLDQIVDRFLDQVYAFLFRRVGNREDAEDLTSEVFLRATRQLDTGRSEASIAGWLFAVARTVLADHWRQYYRIGVTLPLEDTVADVPGAAPENPRAEQRLEPILAALPARYRQVLELRFLQGYSIHELAQAMGVTPENARVMQHRALQRAVRLAEDEE